MATPYTISTIIQQAGGMGLQGAFVYIGARNFVYKHPDYYKDCECRPSFRSKISEVHGAVDSEVSLSFGVNGKRGQAWAEIVCYEPDDTYSVYLLRKANKKEKEQGKIAVVLDYKEDVYCDGLQSTIENMYDSAIKKYNNGFINI